MSTERWERTKQILEEALGYPPEHRNSYLDIVCGADQELRAEVESLISSHEAAGSQFLAAAAPELLLPATDAVATAPAVAPLSRDKVIGHYLLVEELGHGGMGQVWLAEQTAPVKRQVALKLLRGGMFDSTALQRFQSERQSLAIMDHPAIAKVFDAGATPDAQPYFVMEYVPGLPITDYCDQKRLTIPERLELFIRVCEGVQHAHQKAIIHRDLKPANILVVEVDGKPLPRIIDFGLAKSFTPDALGEAQLTMAGGFLGTPGYMSPEQADPGMQDIDTRTDVYSLGAVLYVLLTGLLPFETAQGRKQPLNEALRKLREEDPPRPSTKAGTKTDSTETFAEVRGTEPGQLVSLLRGDLDWITLKALDRDRGRRYPTPTELASDIRRYLQKEPVWARPGNAGYRLGKYVRRHWAGVAVATVIAALLISFGVVQAGQLRRIKRERDRADRIADFMTGMFKVSDPSEARGNAVTAREILDKAANEIDTSLTQDPELRAQMIHIMGNVYSRLGLLSVAQSMLERAIAAGRGAGGPADPEALSSMNALGAVLDAQGHLADGERMQREAFEMQRRTLGPDHPDTLDTMADLSATLAYEGRLAEALKLNREALEKQRLMLGVENRRTMMTMDAQAAVLGMAGRLDESEQLGREVIQIERRVYGPDSPLVIPAMSNLADTLYLKGRYDEAKQMWHQILEVQHRIFGADHPALARSTYNLGCVAARQGNRDEALSYLSQVIDRLSPSNIPNLANDPDLNSLHGVPRFQTLVERAKTRIVTGAKCPL